MVGGDRDADAEQPSGLADAQLVAGPEGDEDLEALVVREQGKEHPGTLESSFVGQPLPEMRGEIARDVRAAVARTSAPRLRGHAFVRRTV